MERKYQCRMPERRPRNNNSLNRFPNNSVRGEEEASEKENTPEQNEAASAVHNRGTVVEIPQETSERVSELIKNKQWKPAAKLLFSGKNCGERLNIVERIIQNVESGQRVDKMDVAMLVLGGRKMKTRAFRMCVRKGLWFGLEFFLQRGVSPFLRRWALDQAAKMASSEDLLLLQPLLSYAELIRLVVVISVHGNLWKVAGYILEASSKQNQNFSTLMSTICSALDPDNPRAEFFQHVLRQSVSVGNTRGDASNLNSFGETRFKLAPSYKFMILRLAVERSNEHEIVRFFIPFCKDCSFMHGVLAERGMLAVLLRVLQFDVGPDRRRAIIEAYCSRASDKNVSAILLPLCSMYERNSVIIMAMDRGFNMTVSAVLQRGVVGHLCRWAIRTTAMEGNESLLAEIASIDLESHFVTVMDDLTEHENWPAVCRILCAVLSGPKNSWAVKLVKQMSWAELSEMCSSLPDEQLQDLMMALIKRGLWRPVGQLLALPNSKAARSAVIDLAIQTMGQEFILKFILPVCEEDSERESVLASCTSRKMWGCLRVFLEKRPNDSHYTSTILQAVKEADEADVLSILQSSSNIECCEMLETLCRRGLWRVLKYLREERSLVLGLQHQSAIQAGIAISPEQLLIDEVSVFAESLLPTVAGAARERGMWRLVSILLPKLNEDDRRAAIDDAGHRANEPEYVELMLPHCLAHSMDSAVSGLVDRTFWLAIQRLMLKGKLSLSVHPRIASEAGKHCPSPRLLVSILSSCTGLDVATTLRDLVRRDLWSVVRYVLDMFSVTDSDHTWAVTEASQRADVSDLTDHVLGFCKDETHLETVLTAVVHRQLWKVAHHILTQSCLAMKSWVVEQGVKHADNHSLQTYILPLHDSECPDQSVTKELVRRGLLSVAASLIGDTGFSECLWPWLLKKVFKRGVRARLMEFLVLHCSQEQRHELFKESVERNRWTLCTFFNDVSHELKEWAVKVAGERASEKDIAMYVVEFCPQTSLPLLLDQSVSRGLWKVVGSIFHKDSESSVSKDQCHKALEEAFARASDADLLSFIVPHCGEYHTESALRTLVLRRLWGSVGVLLQHKEVCEETRTWAVETATHQAPYNELPAILPYCADAQVNSMLKMSVNKGLWPAVGKLLQRSASGDDVIKVITDAYTRAPERDVVSFLLPCRTNVEHESFVKSLVNSGMWRVVNLLWKQGPDNQVSHLETDLQGAVNIMRYHAYKDVFEPAVAALLKRDLPRASQALLSRGLHDKSLRTWVLQSYAECGPEDGFVGNILPDLSQDQRNAVSAYAVCKRRWVVGLGLLKAGVSHSQVRSIVMGAARYCRDERTLKGILEFCEESWNWAAYQQLVKNNQTFVAQSVLNKARTVSVGDLVFSWAFHCEPVLSDLWDSGNTQSSNSTGLEVFQVQALMKLQAACRQCEDITSTQTSQDLFTRWEDASLDIYDIRVPGTFKDMFTKYTEQPRLESDPYVGHKSLLLALLVTPVLVCHSKLEKYKTVISHICRTWIHDDLRRLLLTNAVEKGVREMFCLMYDQCLYDDERLSALSIAKREDNWGFAADLAEFVVSEDERYEIYVHLVKTEDWEVVLQLFKAGADVTRLRKMLQHDVRTSDESEERESWREKLEQLELVDSELSRQAKNMKSAVRRCQWSAVLHAVNRTRVSGELLELALQAAMKKGEWAVVFELSRHVRSSKLRQHLMSRAAQEKVWDLFRLLLEVGVKGRDYLPQLVDAGQWFLAAMVTEAELDQAQKVRMMNVAMAQSEGTFVLRVLQTLHGDELTRDLRQTLFVASLLQETWRVTEYLVKIQDELGTAHRVAALQSALQCGCWRVVRACFGGEVNCGQLEQFGSMLRHNPDKLDRRRRLDLLLQHDLLLPEQDADFFTAIINNEWHVVKRLVELHCDISCFCDEEIYHPVASATTLRDIIDNKQADLIDTAILWGQDIREPEWETDLTALHAVCLAGRWSSLRYCVSRGCNPLAQCARQTVMTFAVENQDCPRRLVAECIKLGVSTFQPLLLERSRGVVYQYISPFLSALSKQDLTLMHMVYESGACNNRELQRHLKRLVLNRKGSSMDVSLKRQDTDDERINKQKSVYRYLARIARTPRSLHSLCRLTISHSLGANAKRHRLVKQLPLSDHLKAYVLFSDLVDNDLDDDDSGNTVSGEVVSHAAGDTDCDPLLQTFPDVEAALDKITDTLPADTDGEEDSDSGHSADVYEPHSADVYAPHSADVYEPPSADVYAPPSADVYAPHSADVYAPHSADVYEPPSADVYAPPSADVVYAPPSADVVYAPPSAGVVYAPPSAGVVYAPPSAGVVYAPPSAGVVYAPPSAGVVYAPPSFGSTPSSSWSSDEVYSLPPSPTVETGPEHPAQSEPSESSTEETTASPTTVLSIQNTGSSGSSDDPASVPPRPPRGGTHVHDPSNSGFTYAVFSEPAEEGPAIVRLSQHRGLPPPPQSMETGNSHLTTTPSHEPLDSITLSPSLPNTRIRASPPLQSMETQNSHSPTPPSDETLDSTTLSPPPLPNTEARASPPPTSSAVPPQPQSSMRTPPPPPASLTIIEISHGAHPLPPPPQLSNRTTTSPPPPPPSTSLTTMDQSQGAPPLPPPPLSNRTTTSPLPPSPSPSASLTTIESSQGAPPLPPPPLLLSNRTTTLPLPPSPPPSASLTTLELSQGAPPLPPPPLLLSNRTNTSNLTPAMRTPPASSQRRTGPPLPPPSSRTTPPPSSQRTVPPLPPPSSRTTQPPSSQRTGPPLPPPLRTTQQPPSSQTTTTTSHSLRRPPLAPPTRPSSSLTRSEPSSGQRPPIPPRPGRERDRGDIYANASIISANRARQGQTSAAALQIGIQANGRFSFVDEEPDEVYEDLGPGPELPT